MNNLIWFLPFSAFFHWFIPHMCGVESKNGKKDWFFPHLNGSVMRHGIILHINGILFNLETFSEKFPYSIDY